MTETFEIYEVIEESSERSRGRRIISRCVGDPEEIIEFYKTLEIQVTIVPRKVFKITAADIVEKERLIAERNGLMEQVATLNKQLNSMG